MIIKVTLDKDQEFDLSEDEDLREAVLEKLKEETEGEEARDSINDFSFEEIHDAFVSLLADDINNLDMDISEYDFRITEVKEEEV